MAKPSLIATGIKIKVETEEVVQAMLKIMKEDLRDVRNESIFFYSEEERTDFLTALTKVYKWYNEAFN